EVFAFGSFRVVPAQRMLLEDGKPLRVGSRSLDILITLVEHAGETISREQLIAHTWPDTVVDDGALRVHVAALRKALGENRGGRRYVANNPGVARVNVPATPMNTEFIGWTAAALLLATIGRQVYSQCRSRSSQGVSKWLFIGQITASTGFVVYIWLLGNWGFVVTKPLMLCTALAGQGIYISNRLPRRAPHELPDHASDYRISPMISAAGTAVDCGSPLVPHRRSDAE